MVKHRDSLDSTFGALADPTRRAILERLARGEAPVTELAAPFEMSLPAISKHLGVLEAAGLLTRERDGRLRRCGLAPGPMKAAAEWIARYQRFWEGQFDALADYRTSPLFSDLERLVIGYAEEMTTRVQVEAALVETLRQHLTPEALVQLTLTIAAANFTNRFNEALGTELEFEEARHG